MEPQGSCWRRVLCCQRKDIMKPHHIKEALLFFGLSLVTIVMEASAITEMGMSGMWYTIPILFLMFAVAAEYGKSKGNR
jgi:hypothetical protein